MGQRCFLGLALLFTAAPALYAQTFTILYSFGTVNGDPTYPSTPGIIAQGRDGSMFSTAGYGDSIATGKAFSITTAGSLKVVHAFKGVTQLTSGLTLGTDGKYYGVAPTGGAYGQGKVFKMTADGVVTTLYSFHGGADGGHPTAPPIESEAGQFYGTSDNAVYKVTRYGDFTLLHTFEGINGAGPKGPLVQGTDYFFYGTTSGGGTSGKGTIFRISRNGDFQLLVSFDGSNGNYPASGVIQASDGNFYGTTIYGNHGPVIFKMTRDFKLSVLHTIDVNTEGYDPLAGLVQATDGNLYGATDGGGDSDAGFLWRITPAGKFTILRSLVWSQYSGLRPGCKMMQHTDGRLYGMTWGGGEQMNGTFYSLDVGLKPFVTYLPTYGRAGASVQILGQGFSAASVVSFNGVPATVTELSPTFLRATVPGGATTGPITVTTTTGTLTSNKVFIIHP